MEIKRRFANSRINTVSAGGTALTDDKDGVNVSIHIRDCVPVCAEVYSDDCQEYAEIGLGFDGKTLVDYDGVFTLPKEVAAVLNELGYNTKDMK